MRLSLSKAGPSIPLEDMSTTHGALRRKGFLTRARENGTTRAPVALFGSGSRRLAMGASPCQVGRRVADEPRLVSLPPARGRRQPAMNPVDGLELAPGWSHRTGARRDGTSVTVNRRTASRTWRSMCLTRRGSRARAPGDRSSVTGDVQRVDPRSLCRVARPFELASVGSAVGVDTLWTTDAVNVRRGDFEVRSRYCAVGGTDAGPGRRVGTATPRSALGVSRRRWAQATRVRT